MMHRCSARRLHCAAIRRMVERGVRAILNYANEMASETGRIVERALSLCGVKQLPGLLRTGTLVMLAISVAATSAQAGGDAEKGEKVFNRCMSCHTPDKGGRHLDGPNLFGVFSREAGSLDDYNYSEAMKNSGVVWNEETLDAYLQKPARFIKGNRMNFAGLRKESQRQDVIAYLKSLQD